MCNQVPNSHREMEAVQAVIEDKNVKEAIHAMHSIAIPQEPKMQKKLRGMLWERRKIFKELGRIKDVQHVLALKPSAGLV